MRDEEFEWDNRKAATNLARQGVGFELVRRAFDDVYAVEIEDRRGNYMVTFCLQWFKSACWQ